MNGIIIVNKEAGFTSHDVVAKLRGILKQKKIGPQLIYNSFQILRAYPIEFHILLADSAHNNLSIQKQNTLHQRPAQHLVIRKRALPPMMWWQSSEEY